MNARAFLIFLLLSGLVSARESADPMPEILIRNADTAMYVTVGGTGADEGNVIAAAQRLHDKGLTTQPDGGYLTERGRKGLFENQFSERVGQKIVRQEEIANGVGLT